MGLHVRERRKLRQIEEGLRRDDPGLDVLLAGRSPPGQLAPPRLPAFRAPRAGALTAGVLLAFLVPPAILAAGLAMHVSWLIAVGAIPCPLIPVIAWLMVRCHFMHNRGSSHCRKS